MRYVGKSDELLLVFSLAWALGLAAFVSLPFIGFNLEIGGFLAGLAMAQTAVHYEVSSRIKSLRDFFIIIFFITLGSNVVFNHLSEVIIPSIIISLFVLLIKPLITMVLVGMAGYKPRTSFMTGTALGQISEFSLILAALGLKQGYLTDTASATVTLSAILTIAFSSYTIVFTESLFRVLHKYLRFLDFRRGSAEKGLEQIGLKHHVIIVGAHRLGYHIVEVLERINMPFVLVDHNPEIVDHYRQQGVRAMCGDINDEHIQELIGLATARLLISTIPHIKENKELVDTIKRNGYKTKLIVAAQDEDEALGLYDQEIDYALLPHFIGGQHLAKILEDDQHLRGLRKLKAAHLKSLHA